MMYQKFAHYRGDIKIIIKRDKIFDNIFDDNDYLAEKYFFKNKFRKIRLNHIREIISARVKEIMDIFMLKNINLLSFKKE